MLTESRRRTCKSSKALEDLAPGRLRMEVTRVELPGTCMEYATCGRFGGLGLKTIGWTVSKFEPQNPCEGPEEEWGGMWRNHGGCVEAKQICEGSVVVRSIEKELDQNAPVVN